MQVGSYFVGQYYQILQQRPDFAHQFYSDASAMIRVDGDSAESVSGMMVFFYFFFKSLIKSLVLSSLSFLLYALIVCVFSELFVHPFSLLLSSYLLLLVLFVVAGKLGFLVLLYVIDLFSDFVI